MRFILVADISLIWSRTVYFPLALKKINKLRYIFMHSHMNTHFPVPPQ